MLAQGPLEIFGGIGASLRCLTIDPSAEKVNLEKLRNFVQYKTARLRNTPRQIFNSFRECCMQAVWVSMAVFALAGAISPGPINVIASAQGAT